VVILFLQILPTAAFLFSFFRTDYMIPQTFTVTSNISAFTFQIFCFTILVVVSVRQIKPIHVGFRSQVKIASGIVLSVWSGVQTCIWPS